MEADAHPGNVRRISNKRPKNRIGLHQKNKLRVGTLNIITLTGKCEEIVEMMERRKIHILGLSETKWKGLNSKKLRRGYKLYWHGNNREARNGVGFVLHKDIEAITDVSYVSERIIKARVNMGNNSFSIIQVYAPQQGCDDAEKEEFLEDLEDQLREDKIMLIGDLNAQVGIDRSGYEEVMGPFGYGVRNTEGENVLDFCVRNNLLIKNTFFKKKDSHKITRYSWDGRSKTVIDYIITDKLLGESVRDTKVIPSECLDSDHRLLVADLNYKVVHTANIRKAPRIKEWKLKDEVNKMAFQNLVIQKLPRNETQSAQEEWKLFKTTLVDSALEVCGKTKGNVKEKETSWWSEKVKTAIKERNVAKKNKDVEKQKQMEGIIPQDHQKIADLEQEYRDKKLLVKRIVKEEKVKSWEIFTQKLEEDCKGNQKMLYGILKSRRSDREDIKTIEAEDGTIHRNVEGIREEMKKYFDRLLNGEVEESAVNELNEIEEKEEEESPITWAETENALKLMKTGKSPGIDGLSADMIKAAGIQGLQWLHRTLGVIWKENKIPDDWKKGMIIPLFKKGSRRKCTNYRGITLLSHCLKITEKIIEKRLRTQIEHRFEEEQHGFRCNRGTVDLVFAVRQLMEKYWEKGKDLIIVFLDLEKAYDSVPRSKIWECLHKLGASNSLIRKIQLLYEDCESCVQIGNGRSEWFRTKRGVQQGSALSPLLFIALMDVIIKEIKAAESENFNALIFADDVAIWGETEQEIQRRLDCWSNKFNEFKLTVSKQKTVAMIMSRTSAQCNLKLDGERIECVESFGYLGSTISNNGSAKLEVQNRVAKGSTFFYQVRNLVWDKTIPIRAKQTMFKAYLMPIMTYSLESCVLLKRDISKLQSCEMKFLRSAVQKTRKDRIRNDCIRRDMQVNVTMEERLRIARLKWFGHVQRMPETRIPRQYLERKVPGKRPVGRPRRKWMDQIKDDLLTRGMRLEDIKKEEVYNDRVRWRHIVHSNPTRPAGRISR